MRPKFNNIGKSPQNTVYCILDIRPRWMSFALGLLFFFTMAILTRDFCLFALKNEHFWLEPKCSANACMSMPYNITITQHFLWERDVILVLENHNIVQLQESTYTIGAQIYVLNIFCLVGLLCCNFVQNKSNYFILNPFSTLHSLVFSKDFSREYVKFQSPEEIFIMQVCALLQVQACHHLSLMLPIVHI